MNVVLPFARPGRRTNSVAIEAVASRAGIQSAAQVATPTILALVPSSVSAEPSRAMVAAAMKSWMEGDPLTAREQRIVDVVCDTNYASQIGRLCLPVG